LQQGALHLRADYLSLEADQKAGEILAQAARINLKPKWDLNVNIGYVGMSQTSALDRYAGSLSRNIPGASAGLVLQYSFPVANNTAKGILWQQRAALRQVRISAAELRRNIYANIGIALEAVVKRNLELSNARKAVQAYQMAVANEQEKFRLGLSSLLDVITIDERLTSALLYLADTGLNFAAAIARLRFESGTLVQMENGRAFVDQTCLTHFALSSCEGR
jgi:outer membrane protein TolC